MAPSPRFQVYGLDETYPELGHFSFKVVLNPKFFKSGMELDVLLLDSDKKSMPFEVKKWGRKLNVEFNITPSVPDGVSTAIISKNGTEVGRLTFWIIKP